MALERPWKKPAQPVEERSTDDLKREVEKIINDTKDVVDDMNRQIDPQRQRVRESVERQGLGIGTTPALESAEMREKNDRAAEVAQRAANQNSRERSQQPNESAADFKYRIHQLDEYEITKNMTGVQIMNRDALLAKIAADDQLRSTPYPVATVVEVYGGNITLKLDKHPLCPRRSMVGETLTVKDAFELYLDLGGEPHLRHIEVEVGNCGTLRSQSDGLTVNWFLVLDAA